MVMVSFRFFGVKVRDRLRARVRVRFRVREHRIFNGQTFLHSKRS